MATNTVLVFRGSITVPLAGAPAVLRWDPPSSTAADRTNQWFGVAVSSVGDHDGDGLAEVSVGMPMLNSGFPQRVIVFRGGASGPETTPAWIIDSPTAARLDFGLVLAR